MMTMKTSLLYIILCLIPFLALGQGWIQGSVRSAADQKGLAAATIMAVGSNTGVLTDEEGNFSLDIVSGETVLKVSHIGFLTKEIKLTLSFVCAHADPS
jgi:hypothetical protein